jgi:hypothetical protein
MKKRTPEESAAYFREYCARKKAAAGAPATPPPKQGATPIATPPPLAVSPALHISGVCPNCEAQATEIAGLRDLVQTLLEKVATMEVNITGSSTTAHQVTPKGDDAETMQKHVNAAKVGRINNYGKNPSIGKASF